MKSKEKNFISAVVYVHNAEATIKDFLKMLNEVLTQSYEKYEIICVDDCSIDKSVDIVKEFGNGLENTVVSVVHMSYYQGLEVSMNAGIDLSIGDFVYEFDNTAFDYDPEVIMKVYEKSLNGYDIVSASSNRNMKFISKCFYNMFNTYSGNPNKLRTESFRVLSRRGINRVHSMTKTIPYRKAVYAGCGLKTGSVQYEFRKNIIVSNDNFRWNTALDSLILFTDIGYKISLALTFVMMISTLLFGVYAIYVFLSAAPIAGWTTTMLVMSFSFFGMFAVSAIIIKYLSVLINLSFSKQKYVIEGIDKITK